MQESDMWDEMSHGANKNNIPAAWDVVTKKAPLIDCHQLECWWCFWQAETTFEPKDPSNHTRKCTVFLEFEIRK